MPYVRISYMSPKPGREDRVAQLLDDLSVFYTGCNGYIQGYRLRPHEHDNTRRTGRLGIWESEEAAEQAAQSQHAMALRSELLLAVDQETHEELSFAGMPDRE